MIAALILAQIIIVETPPPTRPGDYVPGTLRVQPAPPPLPGWIPMPTDQPTLLRC